MLEKKTIQAEEMKAIIDKHAVAPYDDEKLPERTSHRSKVTPGLEWYRAGGLRDRRCSNSY